MGSPDLLVAWMKHNKDHLGLVIRHAGREELTINPDGRFALASTKKVLILLALADRITRGADHATDRVPLSALDRWYQPGLDGGAHDNAIAEFRTAAKVAADAGNETVALEDVAWAMIRWSDNAAADYLLDRVGGPAAIAAVANRLGMAHQEPVFPIYGEMVAWATEADRWKGLSPSARADEAVRLASSTPPEEARQLHPTLAAQQALAQTDSGGTPREWAMLMDRLPALTEGTDPGAALVRQTLGWPLTVNPANRTNFSQLQAKGGSLPGLMTEAWYVVPVADSTPFAITLFFKDLPSDVWGQLQQSFAHQDLLDKVVLDPAYRQKVESALR